MVDSTRENLKQAREEESYDYMEAGPNLQRLADLDVSRLPTFLFYKDGEVQGSLAGTNIQLDEITAKTEKLLG